MGADVVQQRMRFQQKIMRLIQKKTREGPAEILRAEVEVLGAVVGLAEEEACSEFLSLRGVLWDVRGGDLLACMIPSAKGENPPRNWFAFTGVHLM